MNTSVKIAFASLAVAGAVAAGYGTAVAGSTAPSNQPATAHVVKPHLASAPTTVENLYTPVKNCRVVSTAVAGGKIAPGSKRVFQISGTTGFATQGGTSGGCGIPSWATAVTARFTSTSATKSGAFVAYPVGAPVGGLGTLYYTAKETDSTGTTLALSSTGAVTVANVAGKAHLIVDVNGYYAPQLNAFVQSDGSLISTSGRAISTTHTSTGNYEVTFDRDVSKCTYAVTPYAQNWVTAAGPVGTNSVHIYIHDQVSPYTSHDTSFSLTVTC